MTCKVKILSENDDMRDFLEIPHKIYMNDPHWIAPLDSELCRTLDHQINPYFANATLQKFVCYENGNPVARSIVIINHQHWKRFRKKTAFFGFFESINNPEVTLHLFETIERYCRNEGAEFLEGPFNPNHYSELGILTDNFHSSPRFFETYNPEYYPELLEGIDFKVSKRLHTRINADAGNYLRNRYGLTHLPKKNQDFRVRFFRLWNLKADLERIREINNDAFADNWHFLPLTQSEYLFSVKYLFFVTTPGLIVLIEKGTEPVGVIQFMLNINNILQSMHGKARYLDYLRFVWQRRSINEIILYAAGIRKEYQNTQVAWLMLKATCLIAQRYRVISTTWMSDDNVQSIKASEHLGLVPYKWFSVYEKPL